MDSRQGLEEDKRQEVGRPTTRVATLPTTRVATLPTTATGITVHVSGSTEDTRPPGPAGVLALRKDINLA